MILYASSGLSCAVTEWSIRIAIGKWDFYFLFKYSGKWDPTIDDQAQRGRGSRSRMGPRTSTYIKEILRLGRRTTCTSIVFRNID